MFPVFLFAIKFFSQQLSLAAFKLQSKDGSGVASFQNFSPNFTIFSNISTQNNCSFAHLYSSIHSGEHYLSNSRRKKATKQYIHWQSKVHLLKENI